MATDYELLTAETVPDYVSSMPNLADKVDASTLQAQEVGDGNLNLVFVARDAAGGGICIKQSLPYVRLVGEAWPLTPERVVAEARGYEAAREASPEDIPVVFGYDDSRYTLAMENLHDLVIWRTALNEGKMHPGVGAQMGRFVARVAFGTSLFSMDAGKLKERVAESINPELCKITEDLVFTEPYGDYDNNSVQPGVSSAVEQIQSDSELVANVGMLKAKFMTSAQMLLHGDLHSGSVMVTVDKPEPYGKVIDPEFCFYGPVGFDLGALFGNYLAASARAEALDRSEEFRAWVAQLPVETWQAFEAEMWKLWPNRTETLLTDEFLTLWLAEVLQDAAGFGGCKAIRRIIGLAKVSDIETLEGDAHVKAATAVLRVGARWIKERGLVSNSDQLLAIAAEELAQIRQ